METKELRRGNILYYEGQLCKVEQIFTNGCSISYSDSGYTEFVNSVNLHPVELTEERLLRCGFEKYEEYDEAGLVDYRYILNRLNCSITFTSNWDTEDDYYVNYNQGGVDVFYLHLLQNLYFSLTGKELTFSI